MDFLDIPQITCCYRDPVEATNIYKEDNMNESPGTKGRMQDEAIKMGKEQQEKFDKAIGSIGEKMLLEGMTPKDAMGVSSSYMENVYAQAYRLYNTGKYTEAAHLFRILIMLNAMEPKYLLGLAACFHMLKEYYNAIQSYTMCIAIDPENPIPHYHSSDCFIQMKDYLSAMICLELVIDRVRDKPEYAKMKERALLSLESLKKQLASTPPETKTLVEQEQEERGLADLF
jgi:type III secretion system low calcium response chaperone LcrH/SycD